MPSTYTFVRYFNEDDLADIRRQAAELRRDGDSRRPHISEAASEAMDHRLRVLESAIEMLGEPVPQPYGG